VKKKRRVLRRVRVLNCSFKNFSDTYNEGKESSLYIVKQLPPEKKSIPFYKEVMNENYTFHKITYNRQRKESHVINSLIEKLLNGS